MTSRFLLGLAAPAVFALMTGCSSDRNRTASNYPDRDRTAATDTNGTADRAANEADRAANRATDRATTAGDRVRTDVDDYVNKMNAKIDDLRARVDQRMKDTSTKGDKDWDRIKSRLDDLRKDVNDLKTENAINWWDHTKSQIDRAWDNLDKDFSHMMKNDRTNRAQR